MTQELYESRLKSHETQVLQKRQQLHNLGLIGYEFKIQKTRNNWPENHKPKDYATKELHGLRVPILREIT